MIIKLDDQLDLYPWEQIHGFVGFAERDSDELFLMIDGIGYRGYQKSEGLKKWLEIETTEIIEYWERNTDPNNNNPELRWIPHLI